MKTADDRLTLWYSALALTGCGWWQARSALDSEFNLFLLLPLAVWLPIAAIGYVLASALLVHYQLRRWRHVASVLLACLLAWGFLKFSPVNSVDWMIFQITRSNYDISQADGSDPLQPRVKAWLFRDEGAFGSLVIETYVVYDESDEIILPRPVWSAAWQRQATDAGLPDPNFKYLAQPKDQRTPFGYGVSHIQGHWFFVALGF